MDFRIGWFEPFGKSLTLPSERAAEKKSDSFFARLKNPLRSNQPVVGAHAQGAAVTFFRTVDKLRPTG